MPRLNFEVDEEVYKAFKNSTDNMSGVLRNAVRDYVDSQGMDSKEAIRSRMAEVDAELEQVRQEKRRAELQIEQLEEKRNRLENQLEVVDERQEKYQDEAEGQVERVVDVLEKRRDKGLDVWRKADELPERWVNEGPLSREELWSRVQEKLEGDV